VTPCSVVVGYQRFRGPCCLHLRGETSASYHNTTWLHNAEHLDICRQLWNGAFIITGSQNL